MFRPLCRCVLHILNILILGKYNKQYYGMLGMRIMHGSEVETFVFYSRLYFTFINAFHQEVSQNKYTLGVSAFLRVYEIHVNFRYFDIREKNF